MDLHYTQPHTSAVTQFYHVLKTELSPSRPVAKLIAVKSVVFFTYWQSCGIMALHWVGMLPEAIEEGQRRA